LAQREEATLQRLATLQLNTKQKSATPKQKKRAANQQKQNSQNQIVIEPDIDTIVVAQREPTSRSGRILRASQRLQESL
jgi:hypothetical protein